MNKLSLLCCLILVAPLSYSQPLHQFESGGVALASQINENFTNLNDRLSANETLRIDIDCVANSNALQDDWSATRTSHEGPVFYQIQGTCNFDYDELIPRDVTIKGYGAAQTFITGRFFFNGPRSFLKLESLTVDATIRPSAGAFLELSGVDVAATSDFSVWDSPSQLIVGSSTIGSAVNLYSSRMSVFTSSVALLTAEGAAIYFHGGGVTGNTRLINSKAQFQIMGAGDSDNHDSFLTGIVTLDQSDLRLSTTSTGNVIANNGSRVNIANGASITNVNLNSSDLAAAGSTSSVSGSINGAHGSRVRISDSANVNQIILTGSTLEITSDTTVNDIFLVLSEVYWMGTPNTDVNYSCDDKSYIVGESVELCI